MGVSWNVGVIGCLIIYILCRHNLEDDLGMLKVLLVGLNDVTLIGAN